MKKTLIITCLVLSVIGILIAASPFLLRLTGLDKPAKEYLIHEIFGETEHQFDLKKIDIGLGTFEFSEISFLSADKRVEILIDQVVLDFNIVEFLKSPSTPKNALREIYIDQPKLIIHKIANPDRKQAITEAENANLVSVFSELNDYKSLRIYSGKIVYEKKPGKNIDIAQNLDGWLNTLQEDKISVDLNGSVFAPDVENFKLEAELNPASNKFLSRIDIQNYNFDHSIIHDFINDLSLEGTTNGYLEINGNITKLDSIQVDGNLRLTDMATTYKDESADKINIDLILEQNSVRITNGRFNYQNHPFVVNAYTQDLFNFQVEGSIRSNNAPLAAFANYIPADLFNGSTVNINLKCNATPQNYSIQGEINSKDFSVYKSYFNDFKTSFSVSNGKLDIPLIHASSDHFELNGNGKYRFDNADLNIALKGDYYSVEHILFDQLSQSNQRFDINFDLNTETGKSKGQWDYLLSRQDTMLYADGEVGGDFDVFTLELAHSNFDRLQAKIKISDYLKGRPNIEYAVFENAPFHILSSDKILNGLFKSMDTRLVFAGYADDFNADVLVRAKATGDTIATLNARVENLLREDKTAFGLVTFKNLQGRYQIAFNPSKLESTFNFDDQIEGNFLLDLSTDEEQVNGNIKIANFKVLQTLSDAFPENDYRYQGQINGLIDFSGSLKNPKVNGTLRGEKFVYNNVGYFQPLINFSMDRTSIKIDSLNISHNNSELLSGNLSWGLLSDQLFGEIHGNNIDITTVFSAFNLDKSVLTGTGAFSFKLKGTLQKPNIEADVSLTEGLLDGFNYDKLDISLSDVITENSDILNYINHKIVLQKLYLARQGHYHLTSVGTVPLNSEDQLDLVVNFDGDILNLVPRWEPFFKNGASLAEISLKLKGTIDEVRLAAANINIDRGELWLKDVAPHIENLSGKIVMEEGTNKIDMDITAHVDDDYLKIKTVRNITTAEQRTLENWYFRSVNLDFGILSLTSSGDGVFLNIPGLMPDKEYGRIHLSGKNKNETFYFAGPVKHPLGYGVVTLNDALITYPFVSDQAPDQKPSTAVQFLSNMEWDATLKSGKDVLYVRDIPAYIDNVHAEITVDERSEGLQFAGIINRGTFKPVGSLVSTRGRLEYLDQNFKVDRFTLEFSPYKDLPDVSGQAWTTIRDSVGAIPKTIYLQLYAIDEETGQIKQSGNWNDFKFKLVSADPTDQETQEQVLSYLGYSVDNIKEKATNIGGAITEKYLIRPLLRPLERVLERGLGMDLVRFNSSIARNLFYSSVGRQLDAESSNPLINPYSNDVPYLYLMSSSEVTVGKYINENLYLTYTGQLISVYKSAETGYDFNHSLGLEYRFYKNILLEFEWDRELMGYYNIENQRQYLEDFKIRLRHSFTF